VSANPGYILLEDGTRFDGVLCAAPESVTGSDGDVWKAASMLAEKQASTLKPRVADVIPVIGIDWAF